MKYVYHPFNEVSSIPLKGRNHAEALRTLSALMHPKLVVASTYSTMHGALAIWEMGRDKKILGLIGVINDNEEEQ